VQKGKPPHADPIVSDHHDSTSNKIALEVTEMG
jgi:hypothetical protein